MDLETNRISKQRITDTDSGSGFEERMIESNTDSSILIFGHSDGLGSQYSNLKFKEHIQQ